MADNKPTERLYKNISDTKMLEEAQTICDLFNADVADFTPKTGVNRCLCNYISSSHRPGHCHAHRQHRGKQHRGTDGRPVHQVEGLPRALSGRYLLYQEQAFPGNPGRAKKYGSDDYRDMCKYLDKVKPFMDQFHSQAVADNATLNAKGYSDLEIAAIETKGNEFYAALRAQNEAQVDRQETTQERIDILNAVWQIVKRINRASKVVYRGNYAKIQQYLMPAPGTNEARENLSGHRPSNQEHQWRTGKWRHAYAH